MLLVEWSRFLLYQVSIQPMRFGGKTSTKRGGGFGKWVAEPREADESREADFCGVNPAGQHA